MRISFYLSPKSDPLHKPQRQLSRLKIELQFILTKIDNERVGTIDLWASIVCAVWSPQFQTKNYLWNSTLQRYTSAEWTKHVVATKTKEKQVVYAFWIRDESRRYAQISVLSFNDWKHARTHCLTSDEYEYCFINCGITKHSCTRRGNDEICLKCCYLTTFYRLSYQRKNQNCFVDTNHLSHLFELN